MKNIFTQEYHPQLVQSTQKSNLSGAVLVNFALPAILFYIFYNIIPILQLQIWILLHLILFVVRLVIHRNLPSHLNIHMIALSLSSLLYGILAWQALFYSDDVHLLLIGMVIASIVAGSTTTIVSVFRTYLLFVSIQMVMIISAFIYMNESIFYLSALMAISFFHLLITHGYKQYNMLNETLRLHEQVNDLLNHAGEGFLSFNENFKCERSFSLECRNIFKRDTLENADISELLFQNDSEKKSLFVKGMNRAIAIDDTNVIELYLSLLPQEHMIHNRTYTIQYKYLNNNRFMIILRDISRTNKLKSQVEYQRKVQTMLINVVSDKNDFLTLKESFELLVKEIETLKYSAQIIQALRAELHTFKGNFSQKGLLYIPKYIHDLEVKIRSVSSNDKIIAMCLEADLLKEFDKDLAIINDVLGEDFLNTYKTIVVKLEELDSIEMELKKVSSQCRLEQQMVLNEITNNLHILKHISVYSMLKPNIAHVKAVALKCDKLVAPLTIEGDKELKISPRFIPFMKSLIHLFNNCVDHGIEDVDTREANAKSSEGHIFCSYEKVSNILIIKIKDDGRGINTQKVSDLAIKHNIRSKDELLLMSDDEKNRLIFEPLLSTKSSVTSISGIGIGMSSIKKELDALNAKVEILNTQGSGSEFHFYLPLNEAANKHLHYSKSSENSMKIASTLLNQIEDFMQKTLGIIMSGSHQVAELSVDTNASQVLLEGGFEGVVSLFLSDSMNELFYENMIFDDYSDEEKNEILKELPNEVINTLVGLSLQYFDKNFGEIHMSPPVEIDTTLASELKKDESVIYEVVCKVGTLNFMISPTKKI